MGFSSQDSKSYSVVTHYYEQLESALRGLGKNVPCVQIEMLATEAVKAMGSELRDYHKPEHPLDVSKDLDPIPRIAALYHDIVYLQVDPSWNHVFENHFGHFMPNADYQLDAAKGFKLEKDPLRKAILILFGMEESSKVLPSSGLNELLSALVVQTSLNPILTTKEILLISACIEATIAFRKRDREGNSTADRLLAKLDEASKWVEVSFTPAEKKQLIKMCRAIVERDLESFYSPKLTTFLSGTWNVLNENHPALRNTYFLISDYRKAVYSVIPFLKSLDADQMYWSDPKSTDAEVLAKIKLTENNVASGSEYLKAVALSLSLLEAIALETGGDAPFEYIVGPTKKSREHDPVELGAFLPLAEKRKMNENELMVYQVLKEGRELRTRFDRKECRLGAYLYQALDGSEFEQLYELALSFHAASISAHQFLNHIPASVLRDVLHAIAKSAPPRAQGIQALKRILKIS